MYTYIAFKDGISLINPDDQEFLFLQGDDAATLLDEIERAEELDFPRGPFATAEELVSVILDQYDITD